MKKTLNIAIAYFAAAMAGGVFFREFTKFYHYTGTTALARVHGHLLVLGTGLFLWSYVKKKYKLNMPFLVLSYPAKASALLSNAA